MAHRPGQTSPRFPNDEQRHPATRTVSLFWPRFISCAAALGPGIGLVGGAAAALARAHCAHQLAAGLPPIIRARTRSYAASPFPPVGAISRGPRPAMVWPCLHHHERDAHTGLGTPGRPAGPATPHYFVGPALHRA